MCAPVIRMRYCPTLIRLLKTNSEADHGSKVSVAVAADKRTGCAGGEAKALRTDSAATSFRMVPHRPAREVPSTFACASSQARVSPVTVTGNRDSSLDAIAGVDLDVAAARTSTIDSGPSGIILIFLGCSQTRPGIALAAQMRGGGFALRFVGHCLSCSVHTVAQRCLLLIRQCCRARASNSPVHVIR